MILPCILKPFPLQGTDNSFYRLCICEKASRQRGVCVDHLHRCKTSFCLFCVLINNFLAMYAGGHSISLGLCPTKLPVKWDIRLGQLDVPAPISFFVNGNRLSQVPACRSKPFHFPHCCRNLTFYFILGSVASEPSSEQGRRKHTSN